MLYPIIRKAQKVFAAVLIIISAGACSVASRHGIPLTSSKMYASVKTFADSTGTRTVVLVPMLHTAKPEQYKKVSDYLDTLKSHGYVTFNEGILPTDKFTDTMSITLSRNVYEMYYPADSMRLDTLVRKMRKLVGQNIETVYDKSANRRRRVVQSSELEHGSRDYWVDVTFADIIKEYEDHNGVVILSQYDFECPLDSNEYKGKEDKRWIYCRSNKNGYCNTKLARCILESGFDKIAVVYGYSHIHTLYWFVLPDYGYKLVDNPYHQ